MQMERVTTLRCVWWDSDLGLEILLTFGRQLVTCLRHLTKEDLVGFTSPLLTSESLDLRLLLTPVEAFQGTEEALNVLAGWLHSFFATPLVDVRGHPVDRIGAQGPQQQMSARIGERLAEHSSNDLPICGNKLVFRLEL